MTNPVLHVVLYQPEIPQNAGNIGRTCVAIGAKLWMVGPLGFLLEDRYLKRAGMDYWQHLDWEVVDSLEEVRGKLTGDGQPERTWWQLSKKATRLVWGATFSRGDVLVFGRESSGLPANVIEEGGSRNLRLPMRPDVRSLNLASTVAAVAYEAMRQIGGLET